MRVASFREQETVAMETAEGTRRFDPAVSPISDQHDRGLGAVVSLPDLTERERRKERLVVLNRVLRHNLRNTVEVLSAHAELLDVDESQVQHRDAVLESADALLDVAARARSIEEFVASARETECFDLETDRSAPSLDGLAFDRIRAAPWAAPPDQSDRTEGRDRQRA